MRLDAVFWAARDCAPAFRALRLSSVELSALAAGRLARRLRGGLATRYYGERLRAVGVPDASALRDKDPFAVLAALPPSSKEELRASGTDVLRGGAVDPRWRSTRSSGSTGEPFRVFYEPRAWVMLKHLVKLRARAACGLRPHHRVALLDAFLLEHEGRSKLERTGRVRRVSVLQPPEGIATALAAFAPDAIYGFPSALLEAAEAAPPNHRTTPRLLFTSGELLAPAARRALEKAYGCRVHDVYGSTETKEIAWECPAGSAHINADVVHVEVLGEQGEPLLPGEEGELVATLLVNDAMPLLRYRTGDWAAQLPGRCGCGLALPRLGIVTGRRAESLEFAGGHRISHYALTTALEGVDGLLRYQVRQLAPARLRVRALTTRDAERDATVLRIRDALQRAVPAPINVEVEFVDAFVKGPRSKFRVVEPLSLIVSDREKS